MGWGIVELKDRPQEETEDPYKSTAICRGGTHVTTYTEHVMTSIGEGIKIIKVIIYTSGTT